MSRVQDRDPLYIFLRPYICRSFKRAYRKIEFRGDFPRDGAVIFAPNHANALMDALAVLTLSGGPTVFVARADIFKKRPVRDILFFLKILPINRIRDGVDSLKENDAITMKCIDCLRDKVPFCILPEGTHRTQHSLLPLRKGIARIALGTYEVVKDEMPVYIVPVGLEYEDFYRYRSTLLVNTGKPIVLQDFIREHEDLDAQQQMRQLLLLLEERMKETIVYIPSGKDYAARWEKANMELSKDLPDDLSARQERLREESGKELSRKERRMAMHFRKWRVRKGISLQSLVYRRSLARVIGNVLLLILTLPIFLASAVLILPGLLIVSIFKKKMRDPAFRNSLRFVAYTVLNPVLLFPVCVGLAFVLPWWGCLAAYVLSFFATIPFYDWTNGVSNTVSDFKLLSSPPKEEQ